jgi:hypothetical protein
MKVQSLPVSARYYLPEKQYKAVQLELKLPKYAYGIVAPGQLVDPGYEYQAWP